jgi:hypothetical protein
MASPRPPTATPAPAGVAFGGLDAYSGGAALPEGDYAVWFDVRIHQATNKQTGAAYGTADLGVMMTCVDLHNPAEEPKEKFLGMGRKAKETFMPDATGKGLALVPGGPAGSLNNKTNWFYMLKSLYDCGLPEGVFVNDFTTIDGIWMHIQNVPEPEERKNFAKGAKTGDDQPEEERKGSGLMPQCTDILEGGKPWEGTGGMPAGPITPKAAPAARPAFTPPAPRAATAPPAPARPAAPAARPGPRAVAPVAAAPAVESNGDLQDIALNALGEILSRDTMKNGGAKLTLRTETFKYLKAQAGEEAANGVINTFFSSDAALGALLNVVGFAVAGPQITPLG